MPREKFQEGLYLDEGLPPMRGRPMAAWQTIL
jgi:hypothetical protein